MNDFVNGPSLNPQSLLQQGVWESICGFKSRHPHHFIENSPTLAVGVFSFHTNAFTLISRITEKLDLVTFLIEIIFRETNFVNENVNGIVNALPNPMSVLCWS